MGPGYLHPQEEFYWQPVVLMSSSLWLGGILLKSTVMSLVAGEDPVGPFAAVYRVVQPLSGDQLF